MVCACEVPNAKDASPNKNLFNNIINFRKLNKAGFQKRKQQMQGMNNSCLTLINAEIQIRKDWIIILRSELGGCSFKDINRGALKN